MTRINHNIESLVAQNSLYKADQGLQKAIQQLSTGLRVNCSADDPTNLTASEKLRSQIRGSDMVTRNTQDASSLIQIADGALSEVSEILQRMRELTVQAANDTFTTTERSYMDVEFQSLKEELERIADSTEYNGIPLLSGTSESFGSTGGPSVIHIGVGNAIGIDTFQIAIDSTTVGALSLVSANLMDTSNISSCLSQVDQAIDQISSTRSELGAIVNRLDAVMSNLSAQKSNAEAANSVITDVDFAQMTTEMTRNQILTQTSTAMLAQANSLPSSVLKLFD